MRLHFIFAAILAVGATTSNAADFSESFASQMKEHKERLAVEWESGFLGASGSPKWTLVEDRTAPSAPGVLMQTGYAANNWLVYRPLSLKDGRVACQFKITDGKEDPEAGLIWRFIDGQNHYYVRANPLENNVVAYRVHSGRKERIKAVDVPVKRRKWVRLEVDFRGDGLQVFLDGKSILSHRDTTFLEAGRVGLFTMADTVVSFDDFTVAERPSTALAPARKTSAKR